MATVATEGESLLDHQQSDEELMLHYGETDNREAFDILVHRYEASLYSRLKSTRLFSNEEAEQVFQDTWLRVHKMRKDFEAGMLFNNWLSEIAYARGALALTLRSKERRAG